MMQLNRKLPLVRLECWSLPVPVPTLRVGELLSVKASGTESRKRDMLRSNMRRFRHTKFGIVGHALHGNGLPVRQSDAGPLAWEDDPDVCTKICVATDCSFNGVPQPLNSFWKRLRASDGHESRCIACRTRDRSNRTLAAPQIECACGCGGMRPSVDTHNRRPRFIYTHYRHTEAALAKLTDRVGQTNPNWKGDSAQPDSGRQRAQRAYPSLGLCACGNAATDRHHIDGNTFNNSPDNISVVCRKCHMIADGRMAKLILRNKHIEPTVEPDEDHCQYCGAEFGFEHAEDCERDGDFEVLI